jgi:hypothetical protein
MQRWPSTRLEYLWSVDLHLCSILSSTLQVSGHFHSVVGGGRAPVHTGEWAGERRASLSFVAERANMLLNFQLHLAS